MSHPNKRTKKIIFLVDDNATNLTVAEETLSKDYRVIALSSAPKMFSALEKFTPNLILLDIEMPEISGFEAMSMLKSDEKYNKIPVIFLTGRSDVASEAVGIQLGAVDFITKPFTEAVLLTRIKTHMNIDELIQQRTEQLVKLQHGLVHVMADLVENRDGNTGGHIDRTSKYMELLINEMMKHQGYANAMKDWDLKSVISSARLHDLGKIAIPDAILNKPGKLTDEEFEIMKSHSKKGQEIIQHTIEKTGDEEFLRDAEIIAAYHHEKWNGKGYPEGLKECEIPLLARIMALVDVYDALVSERPYKKPMPHEKAVSIIIEDSGTHFDPGIVEIFASIQDDILAARDGFRIAASSIDLKANTTVGAVE
ncbi:MAG: response regulator [Oscillospiraceae bacterium]|nr:response regulator [Oscillospiraceae bacterium]